MVFAVLSVRRVIATVPYICAEVELVASTQPPADDKQWVATLKNLRETSARLVEVNPESPAELPPILSSVEDIDLLADLIIGNLTLTVPQRQELLEQPDLAKRVRMLQEHVSRHLEIARIQETLQKNVSAQFTDMQRRAYLHEQLKAIQHELGEDDTGADQQIIEIREKLHNAKPPAQVLELAERELKRISYIPPASAEFPVIVSYVETLAELPWSTLSEDNLNLDRAQQVLDRDHFDLEKVKRRLVEYLAVRKLNPTGHGPILCFLGPPGVGKTSLGQSIANALGRKFTRVSLGGMRDEAEIRGHRRQSCPRRNRGYSGDS